MDTAALNKTTPDTTAVEATAQDAPRLTLRKADRLRHRTLVNGLYDGGNSLYSYPLRMQWRALSREELEASFRGEIPKGIAPVQMMVTIPKRKQRHAVDRVLMRRRVREAYRLSRRQLLDAVTSMPYATVSLSFVYISDQKCGYAKVQSAVVTLLNKLRKALAEKQEAKP